MNKQFERETNEKRTSIREDYNKVYSAVETIHLHNHLADLIINRLLKEGYPKASVVISQQIILEDNADAKVKTTLDLLPICRLYYSDGENVIEDGNIALEEEWVGYK